jgi:hypothetical protein
MRLRRLAMAGVALLPVVGMANAAQANGGDRGWTKVHVTVTPTGLEQTFVDTVCDPANAQLCAHLAKFPNVVQQGDLVGTTVEADVYAVALNGVTVNVYAGTFDGTVTECGTGTFLYAGSAVVADGTVFEYPIVNGSGTGDLEGITGTLKSNADGTLNGVLRCHRR